MYHCRDLGWAQPSGRGRRRAIELDRALAGGVSKRFVPVIVTDVPCAPHVGVNEEMVGAQLPVAAMVKLVLLVARVPLVTWMGPVVVPVSTSARIWVPDTSVKEAAACPLKSTAVTSGLSKFVPVIVTTQPFAVAVA